jgi:Domain of unknown function (DUF6378)
MRNIEVTLTDRGEKYGVFAEQARITQALKVAMWDSGNWIRIDLDMREALEMIQIKIARILNGDPSYIDSWVDIEGYAHLITQRLGKEQASKG